MQRPMRRADRAMDLEDAAALLSQGTYGVLSTVGGDGKPYAVPLSYIFRNGAIYFHCATEGRKLDNLAANSAVSFCVIGQTKTCCHASLRPSMKARSLPATQARCLARKNARLWSGFSKNTRLTSWRPDSNTWPDSWNGFRSSGLTLITSAARQGVRDAPPGPASMMVPDFPEITLARADRSVLR